MFEKLIPYDAAHLMFSAYIGYYQQYRRITKRAKLRFEHRDWQGLQADSRERLSLYRDTVGYTTTAVLELLGSRANSRDTWKEIKDMYLEEILNFNTRNIAETFFNSVYRHSHKGLSVDTELMFVHATGSYREFKSTLPIFHTFRLNEDLDSSLRQLFEYYVFDAPWEDQERDFKCMTITLQKKLDALGVKASQVQMEVLKSIFIRNKGAYIVGRMMIEQTVQPFVIPFLHEQKGIFADTLLLEFNDVSSIFSFNRSYFLVEIDIVKETVDFMKSILPTKGLGELYNSLGFEKHGKTVLYRDFLHHLATSDDKFVIAPGIKGMVMLVFTLPSYNMVFKVIKDRFAPPKKVTEKIVKEKYEIVFFHDRVGRMADSHMFENFVFDRERFSDELLAELLVEAPSKIIVSEDKIEIKHMYVEKRMIPLNLFLETATPEEAEEVIDEYGNAIKQMAAVNIFPGDMLLKNFGVTRLRRVVFYDYDEIGFLTDYNFRVIPEARDYYEEMSLGPWYSVGDNDVFPEEFPRFLIGRSEIREIFYKLHGDLYNVKFWKSVQDRLKRGEIFDVFPYRRSLRFKNIYPEYYAKIPEDK